MITVNAAEAGLVGLSPSTSAEHSGDGNQWQHYYFFHTRLYFDGGQGCRT